MSSLKEAVEAETRKKGPVCGVQLIIDALNPTDADTLHGLLADRAVPSTAIGRGLARIGHPVKAGAVARHRNGECACD
jgi:hypothetical protein